MKSIVEMSRSLRRVGVPGVAALGLATLIVWGEFVECPRVEREISVLQNQARAAMQQKPRTTAAPEAAAQLATMRERLLDSLQRQAVWSELLSQGRRGGVSFESVHYESHAESLPGVVRDDVSLTAEGSYAALRQWLLRARQDQRCLDIASLALKRNDIHSDQVRAQVVFRLWAAQVPSRNIEPSSNTSTAVAGSAQPASTAGVSNAGRRGVR